MKDSFENVRISPKLRQNQITAVLPNLFKSKKIRKTSIFNFL